MRRLVSVLFYGDGGPLLPFNPGPTMKIGCARKRTRDQRFDFRTDALKQPDCILLLKPTCPRCNKGRIIDGLPQLAAHIDSEVGLTVHVHITEQVEAAVAAI